MTTVTSNKVSLASGNSGDLYGISMYPPPPEYTTAVTTTWMEQMRQMIKDTGPIGQMSELGNRTQNVVDRRHREFAEQMEEVLRVSTGASFPTNTQPPFPGTAFDCEQALREALSLRDVADRAVDVLHIMRAMVSFIDMAMSEALEKDQIPETWDDKQVVAWITTTMRDYVNVSDSDVSAVRAEAALRGMDQHGG